MSQVSVGGSAERVSIYRANLKFATDDIGAHPAVTIIENTVGAVVWTLNFSGIIDGVLAGAFPIDNTWCAHPQIQDAPAYKAVLKRLSDNVLRITESIEDETTNDAITSLISVEFTIKK